MPPLAHSNPAKNQENDNNQEDQSYSSARIISPTPAMRPSRQGAQQRQDKNHNQYCSKHCHSSHSCSQAGSPNMRCGLSSRPQRLHSVVSANCPSLHLQGCRLRRRKPPVPLSGFPACLLHYRWKRPATCCRSPWNSLSLLLRLVPPDN